MRTTPVRRYCAICQGAAGVFVCGGCFQRAGLHACAVDPADPRVVARYQHGGELGAATHRADVDLDARCEDCGRRGTFHGPECSRQTLAHLAPKRVGRCIDKGSDLRTRQLWVRVVWDDWKPEEPTSIEVTVDDTTYAQAEVGKPIALSVVDWNPGSTPRVPPVR